MQAVKKNGDSRRKRGAKSISGRSFGCVRQRNLLAYLVKSPEGIKESNYMASGGI